MGDGLKRAFRAAKATRQVLCQMEVPEPPHYLRTHLCNRAATKLVGGLNYCGQHAKKAERRSKQPSHTTEAQQ